MTGNNSGRAPVNHKAVNIMGSPAWRQSVYLCGRAVRRAEAIETKDAAPLSSPRKCQSRYPGPSKNRRPARTISARASLGWDDEAGGASLPLTKSKLFQIETILRRGMAHSNYL